MTTQASDQPRKFDPAAHLTKLQGKDYLEVKWRLVWLRTECPDAMIETDLKHFAPGEGATFMARVVLPSGGAATGWGSCAASEFGDYLEKAETKAVGRALGALGFGTQFTGEDEGGLSDSPVQRTDSARQQPPSRGHLVRQALDHSASQPPVGRDPQAIIAQGKATATDDLVNGFDGLATLSELNRYVRQNITGKVTDPAALERCRVAYDKAKARIEGQA